MEPLFSPSSPSAERGEEWDQALRDFIFLRIPVFDGKKENKIILFFLGKISP